jgi:tripartite-type tricarboxylate transporter receptor subunit TctC
MKYGETPSYWSGYIFYGYSNHAADGVLLTGFPDQPRALVQKSAEFPLSQCVCNVDWQAQGTASRSSLQDVVNTVARVKQVVDNTVPDRHCYTHACGAFHSQQDEEIPLKLHPIAFKASHAKRVFLTSLAAMAVGGLALPAVAQDYPSKPIKLIVPYPPAGATDVIGRVMAQKLSLALNQQVIVDNRGGAAGSIGAAAVATAAPDGYTLLMGAMTSHSISSVLNKKSVSFDMEKSFAPIAMVGAVPLVFVVHPSVKANTLSEFIALVKSKPGVMSVASSGNGSPQHLAAEMFQRVAGVQMLHVPYKGSGPAMTDLIGGQINSMIETAPSAQAHIKAGKLRPLASATKERIPTLLEVPTATEAGLKGFEVSSMFGIAAPAGTPAPIVAKLNAALKSILSQQDVKDSMLAQGVFATYTTPEETAVVLRDEVAKWAKVIREGNIQPE